MAERLILHVGPRKTGSTYLQSILWGNPGRLADQGFFVPLDSPRAQSLALSVEGSASHSDESERLRRDLLAEIASRPGTAIISSEVLSGWRVGDIRAFMAGLPDVRSEVVFGVRDLPRQIPAEWQQRVRARSSLSYPDWLATVRDQPDHAFWFAHDPERLIGRWRRTVAEERIHAVIVPNAASGHEKLWHRFAEATGLDPDHFDLPEGRLNGSLGIVQTDLLRRVNGALGDSFPRPEPYHRVVITSLTNSALLGVPDAERVVLPEADREWVSERQAAVIGALQARWGQVFGDPEELAWDPPSAVSHSMTVTDGELADEAVRVIVRMLHHIEKTNAEAEHTHSMQLRRNARLRARLQAGPRHSLSRTLRRLMARVRR